MLQARLIFDDEGMARPLYLMDHVRSALGRVAVVDLPVELEKMCHAFNQISCGSCVGELVLQGRFFVRRLRTVLAELFVDCLLSVPQLITLAGGVKRQGLTRLADRCICRAKECSNIQSKLDMKGDLFQTYRHLVRDTRRSRNILTCAQEYTRRLARDAPMYDRLMTKMWLCFVRVWVMIAKEYQVMVEGGYLLHLRNDSTAMLVNPVACVKASQMRLLSPNEKRSVRDMVTKGYRFATKKNVTDDTDVQNAVTYNICRIKSGAPSLFDECISLLNVRRLSADRTTS